MFQIKSINALFYVCLQQGQIRQREESQIYGLF